LFYLEAHNKKASELNKDKLAINNIEYEEDYQSKKRELQEMKRHKLTLQKVLFMLLPTLGITFLIIVLLYFIYEQSRKEVREIKQLVIKNHIIFKDKTKVYINDLMYIKAEDYYIRVFTSDGKNHLVRGRLSDLDEQLPPNFIRTHRSYITNRNFVKQISKTILFLLDGGTIPISRKFKDLLP
jgi:DNA-binding LytR/AlgR family response regulator